MANIFDLVGRIFISLVFLLSGYNKIFNYDNTVAWMEGFGIPGFLLWPAIVLEILLPIFIIIGYRTQISAIILAIFCLATALIFHYDFTNQMQTISFLKNFLLFLLVLVKKRSSSRIVGVRVLLSGRFNGHNRARSKQIRVGVIGLQSTDYSIDYYSLPCFTKYGTFGIKVWLNYG